MDSSSNWIRRGSNESLNVGSSPTDATYSAFNTYLGLPIGIMTRVEQLYTSAAVATGTVTAVGTITETITLAVALIGALCAITSTVAALYYGRKNYLLKVHEHNDKYHNDHDEPIN